MTAAYVPGGLGWFAEISPDVQKLLLELSSARRDFSVNDTLRAVVEAAHALQFGRADSTGSPLSLCEFVLGAERSGAWSDDRARAAVGRVLLVHLARTGAGALDPESLDAAGAAVEFVQNLYRKGGAA